MSTRPRATSLAQIAEDAQAPGGHQVAHWAQLVALVLQTEYQAKKHGGYAIYADGKISVTLDDYSRTRWITLQPDGPTVFSCSGVTHGQPVGIYRPGRWVRYLEGLADKAEAKTAARVHEQREREQADRAARYAPIDDSDLFPDGDEAA